MEFYKLINNKKGEPYYAIVDDGMLFFYEKNSSRHAISSYHIKFEKIYKKLQNYRLVIEESELAKLMLIHTNKKEV